jgi:uncharacterized protein YcbK (DUF882 family)
MGSTVHENFGSVVTDWSVYTNFKKSEFDCRETGNNRMLVRAMHFFQRVRGVYGHTMSISSGYRDSNHSVERDKATVGSHVQGKAADIRCSGSHKRGLLISAAYQVAHEMGLSLGVGVNFEKNFVHIDIGHSEMPRPSFFPY